MLDDDPHHLAGDLRYGNDADTDADKDDNLVSDSE